jgi:hypothetical protein
MNFVIARWDFNVVGLVSLLVGYQWEIIDLITDDLLTD